MEELKAAYPNIRSLVGNSVYVKASVLTKTGKYTRKMTTEKHILDCRQQFILGQPFDKLRHCLLSDTEPENILRGFGKKCGVCCLMSLCCCCF